MKTNWVFWVTLGYSRFSGFSWVSEKVKSEQLKFKTRVKFEGQNSNPKMRT
uniref:Uncharacterized protein n=1 Tax=Myoviridae sp. ctYGJ17 TaxID=2827692 RepID=A0A8S5TJA2_9CAUD|nr:MAG TPA: hypothetical protein [Myoviridae sp. ctYGJ17]